jgi:hypothetical protein
MGRLMMPGLWWSRNPVPPPSGGAFSLNAARRGRASGAGVAARVSPRLRPLPLAERGRVVDSCAPHPSRSLPRHADALFGTPAYGASVLGQLMYTTANGSGCGALTGLPRPLPPTVMMLDRGGCTFTTKVLNAQVGGALHRWIAVGVASPGPHHHHHYPPRLHRLRAR